MVIYPLSLFGKSVITLKKWYYTLEIKGKFIIVENVPARVCLETGERFFSPETVEQLQKMIWEDRKPTRVIQKPVFEFA